MCEFSEKNRMWIIWHQFGSFLIIIYLMKNGIVLEGGEFFSENLRTKIRVEGSAPSPLTPPVIMVALLHTKHNSSTVFMYTVDFRSILSEK